MLGLGEIFKIVGAATTHTERVKLLQKYDSLPLRQIIMMAYHPDVVWGFQKGWVPKYNPCDYHDQENMLYRYLKREIGIFLVPGTHPTITEDRRKKLFVQMLEAITPEDAKLMVALIEKRLPYPGIYRKVVREAFPDIVPPGENKRALGAERRKAKETDQDTDDE